MTRRELVTSLAADAYGATPEEVTDCIRKGMRAERGLLLAKLEALSSKYHESAFNLRQLERFDEALPDQAVVRAITHLVTCIRQETKHE